MTETRQCPRCLATFEPKKRNHVYCVPACKKKAHQEEYGLGGVMLKMGIFDRAGLRRFYAVLDALGSPDRLAQAIGLSDPYTAEQDGSEGKEAAE